MHLIDEYKICRVCKQLLPLCSFNTRKGAKDGHRNDCKACRAAKNKLWGENNKEYITEYNKKYWKENKEILADKHKEYWEENKETMCAKNKQWREENKEHIQVYNKAKYANNKEANREHNKAYWAANKEKLKEQCKKWRKEHPDYLTEKQKEWRENNREHYKEYHEKYREENREILRIKNRAWLKTDAGKKASTKHKQKRRELGFNPINERFDGSEFHHLHVDMEGNTDNAIGLFIPAELHKSIAHNHSTWAGMEEINAVAIDWFFSEE